jgi:hypothetical protein
MENRKDKPGYVNGKYYLDYVDDVNKFVKVKDFDSAINLLVLLIDAIEIESKKTGFGVAPWYYEKLANIYKKLKQFEQEKQILTRFSNQRHSPGVKPPKLIARLNLINNKPI